MTEKDHKYLKIKKYIKNGIDYQNFTDLIPSENQLAEKFGVSRMTARRALVELELEGSVQRIPGKGTYVNQKRHQLSGFFRVRPFRKWAEDLGAELKTRVLTAKICEPGREVIDKLKYQGEVIHLDILNYLDEVPVRFSTRYLRADYCPGILWEDLAKVSIHETLINKYNLPLSRISQTMTAIGLPQELADVFQEPAGTPVFYFKRITFTGDVPVTYVEYTMRGDMAFEDSFQPQLDVSDFPRLKQ
jgi:GntR family transcriptional regulator